MKHLLLAVALLASVSAHARDSTQRLLDQEAAADELCRGTTDNEINRQIYCERRSVLIGRLYERGLCYGKRGQVGAQMKWHKCTKNSQRLNTPEADE
jgi:hypothetical protein